MTLLEEIQRDAVSSTGELGAVLRKCKLLAARLRSSPFEEWLAWESDGYPTGVEVPSYRRWPLELRGHFAGPLGSAMRNAPIPWLVVPDAAQQAYRTLECRQSVASIEELVKKTSGGKLHVSTGDLAAVLGSRVYEHSNCIEAWAEFGVGNLIELLNAVRNRVLDLTLALWKEAPAAGESANEADPQIEPGRVTHIFNTVVYGGAANVIGSATHSRVYAHVVAGDLVSLEGVLRERGVGDEDIEELRTAVRDDERPQRGRGFGPHVSGWIAGMVRKAAEGTWAIGLEAAGGFLAQVICRYYGL